MCSTKQQEANRQNAKKSTGPRTPTGKKRSSQNSLTHGIFCQDIVLPHEQKHLFTAIRNSNIQSFSPQCITELFLVDELTIAQWKLRRLRETEAFIHMELSEAALKKLAHKPDVPPLKAYPGFLTLKHSLQNKDNGALERLALHEQRLQRSIHRVLKELRQLKKDRPADPTNIEPTLYLDKDDIHLNPIPLESELTPVTPSPSTPGIPCTHGRWKGRC
jgi:hypothetical protein